MHTFRLALLLQSELVHLNQLIDIGNEILYLHSTALVHNLIDLVLLRLVVCLVVNLEVILLDGKQFGWKRLFLSLEGFWFLLLFCWQYHICACVRIEGTTVLNHSVQLADI